MAGLPRGFCATCGENVSIRRNGACAMHWIRREGERVVAASAMTGKACKGSGKPPREPAR